MLVGFSFSSSSFPPTFLHLLASFAFVIPFTKSSDVEESPSRPRHKSSQLILGYSPVNKSRSTALSLGHFQKQFPSVFQKKKTLWLIRTQFSSNKTVDFVPKKSSAVVCFVLLLFSNKFPIGPFLFFYTIVEKLLDYSISSVRPSHGQHGMIQVGNFFPFFKFFQSRKEKHFLRCCYLVESLRSNEGRHRTIRAQHVSINRIKNRWIDFIEKERERERERERVGG